MARFVVVPQWQGSPSTRAMALIDGAEAIAGDLPRSASVRVEVPYEAGESLNTSVLRASTLRRVSEHVRETLDGLRDERTVVIGGDCGVAVPAIGHVAGDDLAVVWFDAHGDLHSPDTSPSGAFAGMALRAVLGGAPDGLGLTPGRISPERVVLAGARDLDPAESDYMRTAGTHHLPATDIAERLAEAITATGARRVYVHIDLDVLDPAHMSGVADAQPFGIEPSALVSAIATIRELLPLAGASITGFAPRSPASAVDDMGAILRLVGALAKD